MNQPVNQPASGTTVVRMNGQDVTLTQEELIRNAQQGAEAARVAEENRQLRQELEQDRQAAQNFREIQSQLGNDPEGFMGMLGERYGFNVSPHGTPVADPSTGEPEDEVAQLRREHQAEIDRLRRDMQGTQRSVVIDRELAAITAKYPDADTNAILAYASKHNMPEGTLEVAYKAMTADNPPAPVPAVDPQGSAAPGEPPAPTQQQAPPAPASPNLADQKLLLQDSVLPGQSPSPPPAPPTAAEKVETAGNPLHDQLPQPKRRSLRETLDLTYQKNPDWDPNAQPLRPEGW